MAAIRLAKQMGTDAVEVDVHLSIDGVPVVIHDREVDRRTNGSGLVVDLTFEQLRRLDAGSWFDKRFRQQKIPSLREILEYCRGRLYVNVEVTGGTPTTTALKPE